MLSSAALWGSSNHLFVDALGAQPIFLVILQEEGVVKEESNIRWRSIDSPYPHILGLGQSRRLILTLQPITASISHIFCILFAPTAPQPHLEKWMAISLPLVGSVCSYCELNIWLMSNRPHVDPMHTPY